MNFAQRNIKNYNLYNDVSYIIDNFKKDGIFNKKEFLIFFNVSNQTANRQLKKLGIVYKKNNQTNREYYNNKDFIINKFVINKIFDYKGFCSFFGCFQTSAHKQLLKLGIKYQKKKNLLNEHLLTKEYIEENFIHNKKVNYKEFKEFYNCSYPTISKILKEFDIKYIFNNQQNMQNMNESFIKENFITDNNLDYVKYKEYFNLGSSNSYKYLRQLNIKYIKRRTTSHVEYEIINILKENDIDSIHSDKDLISKELDIVDYSNKFAIEYNGLMFHSHGISKYSMFNNPIDDKKRHLLKTELVEDKDFQLFHIFENEWLQPHLKDIWKSVLLNKAGKSLKIGARKCTIKEVDKADIKTFLEDNHLQGYSAASIAIGLYFENELVSLMTFSKSRYNKDVEYELIRFCNKKFITVQGAASKLLKHFERMYNPKSIISYANRRWSTGNLYVNLGFEFKGNTDPNYFYFKQSDYMINGLYSRLKFQKHKLKDCLENFDSSLTETQNMYNHDYRKIYDSGNKKYIKYY